MVKWILITVIAVAVIGGGVYFVQNRNAQESPNITTEVTSVVDTPDSTAGWKTFVNQEYGFEIKYPASWSVSEPDRAWGAGEPNREFYKVSFLETGENLGYWQGEFRLNVFSNAENLTIPQWREKQLQEINVAKAKCENENPDSPCFVATPEEIEEVNQNNVGGLDSHTYSYFSFDRNIWCDYVTKNQYIYELCYDGMNPNDSHFDEHRKISNDMITSFRFLD